MAPRGSTVVMEIFDAIVNIKSLKKENCDHFLLQEQGNRTMKTELKDVQTSQHICDNYFFFQIDLLTETRLNKIALQGFTLNGLPSFIRTFTLQTSEDGVNYETYQRNGRDVVRFYHTY